MKYFGRNYHAPAYEECEQAPVPVGAECVHCHELIAEGEDGWLTPNAFDGTDAAWHRACFLRGTIGSVAHIKERCACFVEGSLENDPPEMTRRQAAEAALEAFERKERAIWHSEQ